MDSQNELSKTLPRLIFVMFMKSLESVGRPGRSFVPPQDEVAHAVGLFSFARGGLENKGKEKDMWQAASALERLRTERLRFHGTSSQKRSAGSPWLATDPAAQVCSAMGNDLSVVNPIILPLLPSTSMWAG